MDFMAEENMKIYYRPYFRETKELDVLQTNTAKC